MSGAGNLEYSTRGILARTQHWIVSVITFRSVVLCSQRLSPLGPAGQLERIRCGCQGGLTKGLFCVTTAMHDHGARICIHTYYYGARAVQVSWGRFIGQGVGSEVRNGHRHTADAFLHLVSMLSQ